MSQQQTKSAHPNCTCPAVEGEDCCQAYAVASGGSGVETQFPKPSVVGSIPARDVWAEVRVLSNSTNKLRI